MTSFGFVENDSDLVHGLLAVEAPIKGIEQIVQLHNLFFITSMAMPRGTATPILLKWFLSRDVPIGFPSYNCTLIPIISNSFRALACHMSLNFIFLNVQRSINSAHSPAYKLMPRL